MSDWNDVQKKRFAPVIAEAMRNLETNKLRDRLVELREGRDEHNKNFPGTRVSQRALSEILDILPQNYNRIEIGKANKGNDITLRQAIKLAAFYGCTLDYLVAGKDYFAMPAKLRPSDDQKELINILKDSLAAEKELNKILREENEKLKKKKGTR